MLVHTREVDFQPEAGSDRGMRFATERGLLLKLEGMHRWIFI